MPRLIFLLVVFASRVPLLGGGFGSDGDSWRNAVAALRMREAGHYVASRPPGFPVFESLLVPLVPWGWVATNALAALAGVAAAAVFLRICRESRIPSPYWLTFAFAFGGVLWVYATQTMDYALGLALLLGTYHGLRNRRYFLAGLLLALAAGCRLTTATLVVPALAMLLVSRAGWRAIASFLTSYVLATAAVYVPVILYYRAVGSIHGFLWHASRTHVTLHSLPSLLRLDAVFLFGKLGSLMLVLALAGRLLFALYPPLRAWGRARMQFRLPAPGIVFEAGVVLVVATLYLMAPYEAAYLIPLLPFALLLVGRLLTRPVLAVAALLIASEVLVVPMFDKRGWAPGRLQLEIDQRREGLRVARALEARRPAEPTVFVVGRVAVFQLHVLAPSLERDERAWRAGMEPGVALWSPDRRRGYAALLGPSDRQALEDQGYRVEVLRE